jgi:undecaprenyl-diphosphatase
MDLLQSLILGVIQGLTEFLPISSTAHLILAPYLFGWVLDEQAVFIFDVLLQLGTVIAVVVYFWRDLLAIVRGVLGGLAARQPPATPEARLGWLIVVATIPAVVIGLLLKDSVEALHRQPVAVAIILMAAAFLIFLSERLGRRAQGLESITWLDAFLIGCSQALALLPGVSRSAATICGGLLRGLDRPAAARFSFLMSIPALTGAGVLALNDLFAIPNFTGYLPALLVGTVASLLVGLACIHWLLGWLARRSLAVFGWYRLGAGVIFLAVLLLAR